MTKFIALILSVGMIYSAQAKDGRDWHSAAYDMGCKTCHDQGLKNYPSDNSCLNCHDTDDLAKTTKRSGDEVWQNPHNNLHYGKDTPCIECHSEHTKNKQPMCLDCHTFKYEKFKG